MTRIRTLAATLVLYLFPLFIAAVFAGVGLVVWWLSLQWSGWFRILLQLVILPLIFALLGAILVAVRSRPQPTPGPELAPDAAPQLWASVTGLAQAAQTPPPARIVLVPEANAWVAEPGGVRELAIGLPLLGVLTVSELRAVLGHELGHFAGGDTAQSARLYRARLLLSAMRDNANLATRWLFTAYLALYQWVASSAQRDAERRADEFAVRAAGSATAARALRQIVVADAAWSRLNDNFLGLMEPAGRRGPLAEGTALVARHTEGLQQAADEFIAHEQGSLFATHPPTRDRMAALQAMPSAEVATDDRVAWELVGGPDRLAALEGDLLVDKLPLASWNEIVGGGAGEGMRTAADSLLVALVQDKAIPEASYAAGFDLAEREGVQAGARLVNPPQEPSEGFESLLVTLAMGVLAAIPGARADLDWTREAAWLLPSGERLHAADLVKEVGGDPVRLRERLTALGGDTGRAVDVEHLPRRDDLLIEVWPQVKLATAHLHLVAYDTGLLLLPAQHSFADRLQVGLGGAIAELSVLDRGLSRARQVPGARWIPLETLTRIKVPLLRSVVILRFVDGHVETIKRADIRRVIKVAGNGVTVGTLLKHYGRSSS